MVPTSLFTALDTGSDGNNNGIETLLHLELSVVAILEKSKEKTFILKFTAKFIYGYKHTSSQILLFIPRVRSTKHNHLQIHDT